MERKAAAAGGCVAVSPLGDAGAQLSFPHRPHTTFGGGGTSNEFTNYKHCLDNLNQTNAKVRKLPAAQLVHGDHSIAANEAF